MSMISRPATAIRAAALSTNRAANDGQVQGDTAVHVNGAVGKVETQVSHRQDADCEARAAEHDRRRLPRLNRRQSR
jgi:hypothetical protein